ncbi:MAG: pyridoxamine 5'-phosphate oxidase [Propionibacteriales bacterium]|nr:pyridoxamine 5'-phosphate oxidase [Propionibacteriales bacterium]
MNEISWQTLRNDYAEGGLVEFDLAPDPLVQLRRWLTEAHDAGLSQPNALVLATADATGAPSVRMLLLKGIEPDGLLIYTNYESRKARELAENPQCALVFPWHPLERQVRIDGEARRADAQTSDGYFASRPRGAQLGAWASPQSAVVPDRAALESAYDEASSRWPEPEPVPRPPHWGGYVVRPHVVEFWQGRPGRMHDRLRYRRTPDADTGWTIERLAP